MKLTLNAEMRRPSRAAEKREGTVNAVGQSVENGNVVLLKKGAAIEGMDTLDANTIRFAVNDALGQCQAALTPDGHLHLAGTVTESVADLAEPEPPHTALVVKDKDGNIVSLIDDQGNLKMRGYLLLDGIPYRFKQYETTDGYSSS